MHSTSFAAARRCFFLLALAAWAPCAFADRPGVQYDVVISKAGKVLANPVLVGLYGQAVRFELAGVALVEAMCETPAGDGRAKIHARFHEAKGKVMGVAKEQSMSADLAKTPVLQYTVPGSKLSFKVRVHAAMLPGI
jgi:hypothetical protein